LNNFLSALIFGNKLILMSNSEKEYFWVQLMLKRDSAKWRDIMTLS